MRTLLLLTLASQASEIAADIRQRDGLRISTQNLPNGTGLYCTGPVDERLKTEIAARYNPKPRVRRRAA